MRNMGKVFSLLLIAMLAVSSLSLTTLMVKPTFAQTSTPAPTPTPIPTPSVPQFTLMLVNDSHYTQPTTTTTTNPYTGEPTTTTTPSQYVQDEYIEVKIQNQSFTPLSIADYVYNLYFDVQTKGHFSEDWTAYNSGEGYSAEENYTAQYTTVELYYNNIPPAGLIDFQVQAIIGYVHAVVPVIVQEEWVLSGQAGGWSNIETINVTDGSVFVTSFINPTPTPALTSASSSTTASSQNPTGTPISTSTPVVPEMSWLGIVLLLLSVLSVVVILARRKPSTLIP